LDRDLIDGADEGGPTAERAVRDLLRKRSQRVRQRSTRILSIESLLARNLGQHASRREIKRWAGDLGDAMPLLEEQKLALEVNLASAPEPGTPRLEPLRGA
jgi:hypothetical protein